MKKALWIVFVICAIALLVSTCQADSSDQVKTLQEIISKAQQNITAYKQAITRENLIIVGAQVAIAQITQSEKSAIETDALPAEKTEQHGIVENE